MPLFPPIFPQVRDFAVAPVKEERFRALQLCVKVWGACKSCLHRAPRSMVPCSSWRCRAGRSVKGHPGRGKHVLGKIQAGKPFFPG